MFVRFWGTRGSIPTPGNRTAIYGGNTSCVEVRAADGTIIILDCGTGIRELGLQLLKSGPPPERLYLLIGHTHWDHIQGFPFFTPAFLSTTELNIFAPAGFQRGLEDSLSAQMQYAYFPVKLQDLSSRIHFTELEEGFFRIGEVLLETQYLNHTAPTIAYRITSGGATMAYVTDHEPFWTSPEPSFHHPGDQRHIAFLKGADLVIHDAQYTVEEYQTKKGWGHSTVDYATDVAMAAGAGRLALFHHDPEHSDDVTRKLEEHAQAKARAAGSKLEVFAAAEGMGLELTGRGSTTAVGEESALERRPVAGSRILVVSAERGDIAAIEQVFAEDGLIVSAVPNLAAALEKVVGLGPDLAILGTSAVESDKAAFAQTLRSAVKNPDLPVVILTNGQESVGVPDGVGTSPTDYLSAPFSPPMLRSRVRAWLARTMPAAPAPVEASPQFEVTAKLPLNDQSHEDRRAYADVMASVALFRSLNLSQLDTLMARATPRTYPAGHVIIRQGEPGRNVYVTMTGRVRIVEALPDNPVEMLLGELGSGEIFGELSSLWDSPRSATVITLERTNCLVIPERDFLEALHASPEMSMALLRVLAGRLYDADRLLARHAPDPLTGLPGRRAFHELYRRLAAGARRRGSSVLLIMLDVVHLKSINDRFGYNVGDDVLRTVADALLESSRSTDLVARSGSDEFAALLVEAGEIDAEVVIDRVRRKLAMMVSERGLPLAVECKVGCAVSPTPPDTIDELLRTADRDMQVK